MNSNLINNLLNIQASAILGGLSGLLIALSGGTLLALSAGLGWWAWNFRKKEMMSEHALADCEERYQNLVSQTHEGVLVSDGVKILFCNESISAISGFSNEELKLLPFIDLFHDEDQEVVLQQADENGEAGLEKYPLRIVAKDGEIRWVTLQYTAVEWNSTNAFQCIVTDITPDKELQENLKYSEEHFTRFMDMVPAAVFIKDEESRLIFANRYMKRLFNIDGVIGKKPQEAHSDDMAQKILEEDRQVFRQGFVESVGQKIQGHRLERYFQTYLFSFQRCQQQNWLGGIALDITERKKIEEELKKSEEHYRLLFQRIPMGIFQYDQSLQIRDYNEHFRQLFNMEGKKPFAFDLVKVQDEGLYHALKAPFQGEEGLYEGNCEGTDLKKGVYISLRTAPFVNESKSIESGIGVVEDITERKLAEAQIQNQLKQLSSLRSVDMAIANNTDLASTLRILLHEVITQLNVDAAALLLLNPHNAMLECAAQRGFRTPFIQSTCLGLGEGYAGQVAQGRRMIHVSNLTEDPRRFLRSPMVNAEGFYSYYGIPLIAKGHVRGVLEIYHRSYFEASNEWLDFLSILSNHAAIAIENTTLFEDLQQANSELVQAYDSTIEGWARALEMRDGETEGHSQRVTEMAVHLAKRVGLSDDHLVHVRRGALLHDIGKMGIPDSILLKPGSLSSDEWDVMRKHPLYAYRLLASVDFLRPALDIPYYHHERWDGNGYPRGLCGQQIPMAARVFSIVDVWDALRSNRPYRSAWEKEKVIQYIEEQSGKYFDPDTVQEFLRMQRFYNSALDH